MVGDAVSWHSSEWLLRAVAQVIARTHKELHDHKNGYYNLEDLEDTTLGKGVNPSFPKISCALDGLNSVYLYLYESIIWQPFWTFRNIRKMCWNTILTSKPIQTAGQFLKLGCSRLKKKMWLEIEFPIFHSAGPLEPNFAVKKKTEHPQQF